MGDVFKFFDLLTISELYLSIYFFEDNLICDRVDFYGLIEFHGVCRMRKKPMEKKVSNKLFNAGIQYT